MPAVATVVKYRVTAGLAFSRARAAVVAPLENEVYPAVVVRDNGTTCDLTVFLRMGESQWVPGVNNADLVP
jgi:hypothetical protein